MKRRQRHDRAGQQLGHYRLLRLRGQGGFADVYLAEHLHLDTQVAVNVLSLRLSSDSVKRFRAEDHRMPMRGSSLIVISNPRTCCWASIARCCSVTWALREGQRAHATRIRKR
jgi:serine/threonine protein kinase